MFPLFHDINVSFEKTARRLKRNFRNDFILLSENWLPPPGSSNLPDKSGSDQDHVKTESMKTLGKHLFPTYCIKEIFRIPTYHDFFGQKHGLQMPNEAFFHWNPELLGLGRQIGQINSGAFEVFSAKLSAPILLQWVPCPCFLLFNHYFYKKHLCINCLLK